MDDGLDTTEAAVVVWELRGGALLLRDGAGGVGKDEKGVTSPGGAVAVAAGDAGAGEAGVYSRRCADQGGVYAGDG